MKHELKVNLKVSHSEKYTAGAIFDDEDPKYTDLIERNSRHFEPVKEQKLTKPPVANASPNKASTTPAKPVSAKATNAKIVKPPAKKSAPAPKAVVGSKKPVALKRPGNKE